MPLIGLRRVLMSRVNARTVIYRVSKVVSIALLFGTLQAQSAVAIVSTPSITPDSPGVNTSVYFNGSPIREGASIPNSSSVLIGTAALLSPGLGQREIITTFDAKTIYQTGTARGPEGWTLEYNTQTSGGTWSTTEPNPASGVKRIRAINTSVAAGAISGTSQNFSSQTISSIPSGTVSASSGGDGWGVTIYDNYLFNIYHHTNSAINLACRVKSTGSACSGFSSNATFDNYRASMRSDAWVNPVTGKLYAFTASSDLANGSLNKAGFLCVNVAAGILANSTPTSCGFFSGTDSATATSYQYLSEVANIGTRVFGLETGADGPRLVCIDTSDDSRCSGSGMILVGAANGGDSSDRRLQAIGTRLFIKTSSKVYCFVGATLAACSGSWPQNSADTAGGEVAVHTDASGIENGFCTWNECFDFAGNLKTGTGWTNPFSISGGKTGAQYAMRGVTTLGRFYWSTINPGETSKSLSCFDFSAGDTATACSGFSAKHWNTYLYDVRVDPQNPSCLWTNADNGIIRNLDAITGTLGCSQNAVITLQASQFAPRYSCSSDVGISTWTNIKITDLVGAADINSTGQIKLTVRNALGEIVTDWKDKPITLGSELSMSALSVAMSGSRPTFSFSFSGFSTQPSSATISLNYLGKGPELCANAVVTGTNGDEVAVTGLLNDAISASPSVNAVRAFVIGDSTTNRYYTLPSAPRDLVGTGLNTTVTLTFKPPLDDGGYTLGNYLYSIDGTNYSTANSIVDNGDGTRSITITGLTPGQTYTNAFKVAATNPLGTGLSATIASLTVQRLSLDILGNTKVDQGPLSMLTSVDSMAVTYAVSPAGVCTQTAGVITLVAVGTCTVTADQAGDATHVAATTTKSFQVLAADVVIVAPGAPTSLLAARGSGQIGLSWTAPASNGGSAITDYVIQYLYGGTWIPFVDGTSNTTSAIVTGLTNGTVYDFRVAAVNIAGQGNWSTSVTSTPATVPGPVTSLSGSLSSTTATVQWTPPADPSGASVTGFKVSYKLSNSVTWSTPIDDAASPALITGLTSGSTYDYLVTAVNAIGESTPTSTVTLQNIDSDSSTALTWVSAGAGITNYKILYKVVGGSSETEVNTASTGLTSTLTSLVNGTSYEVRVAAYTDLVISSYSSTVLVTPRTVPAAPVVTATPGTTQVTLSWAAPINNGAAITDYVIKYRITGDSSWITKVDGVNTNTSYVVPNLLNATTYDFQVFAKNSAGDGVGSSVVTGKPFTTPSAPTGISAVSGQGAVTVTWNVPSSDGGSSITDYSIQYKRLSDTSWIDYSHAPSTSTTFTLSSLLQLSQYSFRLAAVNAAGTGTYSAATSQSTLILAPAITLTSTSGLITIGQAMPVYGVNSAGGTVSSYAVSTLPGGLSFNTSTGVISGTPTALMSASIFTITATNTSGAATATYTLTVSAVPVVVVAPVTPTPVVQTGPPPSSLKIVSSPKISRDSESYYCEIGKYVFLREGRTEESPKLTTRVFSLLLNGKVIETLKSGIDKVSFDKSDTYLDSTLTCQIEVGQENVTTTSYSLNYLESAVFSLTKKNAIVAADAKYYKDREDAYTKKDLEFARLLAIKISTVSTAKASKDLLAASLSYQKAYTAASNLWKKELADAATNRVLAKELAQKQYLDALEAAGISIYPVAVKAVVTATPTPTPTPTPKPTPTPTPSPTATNVQPTAAMKLAGTFYMATGSYFLNNATKISLKALALKINSTEVKQVLVYGHTDNRGGVNNTWLSQQRSKAVASYLRPLLRGKKLVIGWYASRKPAATGTSKADLAKNRRVEIYVK